MGDPVLTTHRCRTLSKRVLHGSYRAWRARLHCAQRHAQQALANGVPPVPLPTCRGDPHSTIFLHKRVDDITCRVTPRHQLGKSGIGGSATNARYSICGEMLRGETCRGTWRSPLSVGSTGSQQTVETFAKL